VPVDPVHLTARMSAAHLADGADNIAGWWMDTITATPAGGHVDIVGSGNIIDTWESVLIDRDLSFNLNSNFVYTVYDNDTFTIAEGVNATVSNGVIYVGEGFEGFGGDTARLQVSNVRIVKLDEDFYQRTYMFVDSIYVPLSEAMDYFHSGVSIELIEDFGMTIDAASNAVLLDGMKIAELPAYQSFVSQPAGGTTAYTVQLNDKAAPECGFELTGIPNGNEVLISVTGVHKGFYYAVQHKSSLVEAWSEPKPDEWLYADADDAAIQFRVRSDAACGFYRVKVTDWDPAEN